jgi:hypothetical protein
MKKQIKLVKTNFIKKIFIKICRILGYEIIDQNNLYLPTSNKYIGEELSKAGKKSINLPLGEVKITRSVQNLDVIIKTCTSVNLVSQSKERIFKEKKSEYTFRSINSILKSMEFAKNKMPNVLFRVFIIDHNSGNEDLKKIENQLIVSKISYKIINLNISEFENKIKKINEKNEKVGKNMFATMSSIYKSFLLAKESCNDLIYFVEDDYIHQNEAISEMLFTYERISSQSKNELIICPSDYPFLYNKLEKTQVYLGNKKHWRTTEETLLTFMISKKLIEKYWKSFENMCRFENSPFEKPLHKMYEHELCLSPIPSLAMHCTNINSVFGLPPNFDWEKTWEENKNY